MTMDEEACLVRPIELMRDLVAITSMVHANMAGIDVGSYGHYEVLARLQESSLRST
jgi:hypothetical protein